MNVKLGRAVLELAATTKEFLADLDKADEGGKKLRDRFKAHGKDLKSFGKDAGELGKMLSVGLTAPIAAVATGLVTLAVTSAKAGDAIAKNARESGLSARAYQELTFAIGQVADVTDEELTKAFGKATIVIADAAAGNEKAIETLERLGFTQEQIAAGTLDTEQVLTALTQTMQSASSEAEAMALAGDLVGDRVGPKLAGALRSSGAQVDLLRKQFRDLGLGMSDDALAASEQFNDQLDVVKRQLGAVTREIGSAFLPILTDELMPFLQETGIPLLREVARVAGDLIGVFRALPAPVQGATVAVGALAAATGPALMGLGKLVSAAGDLSRVLGTYPRIVAGLGTALTRFLPLAAMVGYAWMKTREIKDEHEARMRQLQEEADLLEAFRTVTGNANAAALDWTKLTAEQRQKLLALAEATKAGRLQMDGLAISLDDAQAGAKGASSAQRELLSVTDLVAAAQKQYQSDIAKTGRTERELIQILGEHEEIFAKIMEDAKASPATIARLRNALRQQTEATKEATEAARELQARQDALFGRDLLTKAEQFVADLGDVANVALLSPDLQAEVLDTLTQSLATYERLGRTAPAALLAVREALVPLVAQYQLLAATETDVFRIQLRIAEIARQSGRQAELPFSLATGPLDLSPTFAAATRVNLRRPGALSFLGTDLKAALGGFSSSLGPTILQAMTGGGSVSQSIGGLAGLKLGESLSTTFGGVIKKTLGDHVGGALASFLPGVGALVGPLIGRALSGLGRLFGFGPSELQRVREARAEWLKAAGGLDKLNESLRDVAGDPRVRAAWNDLFNARTLRDYEAALARFNTTVEEAHALLREEQEAREFLQRTVEKYGFTVDQLGDKWKQQALTDEATLLLKEYTALTRSGIDHNLVLEKMGKNLNEFFLMALKTGAEVPEQLRPLLRQMIEQGTLLDENGEAFDLQALDSVHWSQTLTENIDRVIAKLGELIDAITGKLGQAIEDIPTLEVPIGGLPIGPVSKRQGREMPSFASEAYIRKPTMALLHADEFVLRRDTVQDWMNRALVAGRASALDGEGLARQIVTGLSAALGRGDHGAKVEVRVFVGNRELSDYIVETNLRKIETNDGGGATLGPNTRLRAALGIP